MKLTTTLMTLTMLAAPVAIAGENNWEKGAKDAWIDGKAETTLLLNTNLNSFDINTDVKDGVVVLTGKVDSEVDKSLASELIESLDGVNKVDNRLEVMSKDKPSEMAQTLTDSKVVAVVKTRLLIESEVTGTDINVDAKQGVVTLEGTVASDAERDLAITIAKNTSDVKKVVDKLEVVEKS
ncbi:BON domain-containing protein [Bowmanella denitrificans]|uniref:BON domain-containing protein n=1 Tax=Bowmanella denitrificans TaxID=366582 RepID=A0ABN0XNK6_9ALTE